MIALKENYKKLMITDVVLLELDPLLVRDLQYVGFDEGIFTASSVNMIRKCISPADGALKEVNIDDCEHVEQLFPIVFNASSLDELNIIDYAPHISDDAMKPESTKTLFSSQTTSTHSAVTTALDYLANLFDVHWS